MRQNFKVDYPRSVRLAMQTKCNPECKYNYIRCQSDLKVIVKVPLMLFNTSLHDPCPPKILRLPPISTLTHCEIRFETLGFVTCEPHKKRSMPAPYIAPNLGNIHPLESL